MAPREQRARALRDLADDVPWVREHLPRLDVTTFAMALKANGAKVILVTDEANGRQAQIRLPRDFPIRDPLSAVRALHGAQNVLMAPFN